MSSQRTCAAAALLVVVTTCLVVTGEGPVRAVRPITLDGVPCTFGEVGQDVHHDEERVGRLSCRRWLFNTTRSAAGGIIIGGLIPIYRFNATSGSCSTVENGGMHMQILEAFLVAVRDELKSSRVAASLIDGVEIRDSCLNASVAVEQVANYVVHSSIASDFCDENSTPPYTRVASVKPYVGHPAGGRCSARTTQRVPVVIGPTNSQTVKATAPLLSVFQIPHIAYWATSPSLTTDLQEHPYLFRTVPSDTYGAMAMADLTVRFNWTYVAALTSRDEVSGGLGLEAFRNEMTLRNRCISFEKRFNFENKADVESIVKELVVDSARLKDYRLANVVALFAGPQYAKALFSTIKQLSPDKPALKALKQKQLVWLASDGWANLAKLLVGDLPGSHTVLGVVFKAPREFQDEVNNFNKRFYKHFYDLDWQGARSDPWLNISLPNKKGNFSLNNINCSEPDKSSNLEEVYLNSTSTLHNKTPTAKGDDFIAPISSGSLFLSVRAAVSMIETAFTGRSIHGVAGEEVHAAMLGVKVACSHGKKCLLFQQAGHDVSAVYAINLYNGQRLKTVGEWQWLSDAKRGHITWNCENGTSDEECVKFRTETGTTGQPPVSHCSLPCSPGWEKQFGSENGVSAYNAQCCWRCKICPHDRVSATGENCTACPVGFMANDKQTDCIPIDPFYVDYTHGAAISIVTIAVVSAIIFLYTMAYFYKKHNTDVVIGAGYRLSNLLLVGLSLGMLTVVTLFVEPTTAYCSLQLPLVLFFQFWTTVAILLRVFRLVAAIPSTARVPKFLGIISQKIAPTFNRQIKLFISVTIAYFGSRSFWMIIHPREAIFRHPAPRTRHFVCADNVAFVTFSFGVNLALELFTVVSAYQTRKLSTRRSYVNESKLVLFAGCSILLFKAATVPIYAITDKVLWRVLDGLSTCAHMLGIWSCLFLPRIYQLWFSKYDIPDLKENHFKPKSSMDVVMQMTTYSLDNENEQSKRPSEQLWDSQGFNSEDKDCPAKLSWPRRPSTAWRSYSWSVKEKTASPVILATLQIKLESSV